MFKMSSHQITELCHFARIADKEARSDLSLGFISNENDYTSNFTGALRRIINSNSKSGLSATSYVLAPSIERDIGCDAAIVITSGGQYKIAAFEGKYPRFIREGGRWDYPQTSTGLSHFSDQLDRQASLTSSIAIFEMFYCEYPFSKQPKHMQDDLSSCVWHDDALNFENSRTNKGKVWSPKDLVAMLKKGNVTIAEILERVCECTRGAPQNVFGDAKAIAREFSLCGYVLHVSTSPSEDVKLQPN